MDSISRQNRDRQPEAASSVSGFRQVMQEPLLRLLAINWAFGAFAAAIVTAGLLALDTAGLRSLISSTENPFVPVALLFGGLLVTLSSAAMGAAIMALPGLEPRGGKKHKADGGFAPALVPIPVEAAARRRR